MKRKLFSLLSVIVIFISIFSFAASAEEITEHNIDFSLPNEFVVLTEDNTEDNIEALKSMGFTESSFKSYINSNNILLFASLTDKSCQITVNVASNSEFSEKIGDFADYDNEDIEQLLPKLITSDALFKGIESINGNKFIVTENSGNDKAGTFTYYQYITVKNRQLYTVTFSFDRVEVNMADYAENLMKEFTIEKSKEGITLQGVQKVVTIVILVVVILALAVAIIYIAYTIISDIVANRNTSDVAPYVKIKRRRFK